MKSFRCVYFIVLLAVVSRSNADDESEIETQWNADRAAVEAASEKLSKLQKSSIARSIEDFISQITTGCSTQNPNENTPVTTFIGVAAPIYEAKNIIGSLVSIQQDLPQANPADLLLREVTNIKSEIVGADASKVEQLNTRLATAIALHEKLANVEAERTTLANMVDGFSAPSEQGAEQIPPIKSIQQYKEDIGNQLQACDSKRYKKIQWSNDPSSSSSTKVSRNPTQVNQALGPILDALNKFPRDYSAQLTSIKGKLDNGEKQINLEAAIEEATTALRRLLPTTTPEVTTPDPTVTEKPKKIITVDGRRCGSAAQYKDPHSALDVLIDHIPKLPVFRDQCRQLLRSDNLELRKIVKPKSGKITVNPSEFTSKDIWCVVTLSGKNSCLEFAHVHFEIPKDKTSPVEVEYTSTRYYYNDRNEYPGKTGERSDSVAVDPPKPASPKIF